MKIVMAITILSMTLSACAVVRAGSGPQKRPAKSTATRGNADTKTGKQNPGASAATENANPAKPTKPTKPTKNPNPAKPTKQASSTQQTKTTRPTTTSRKPPTRTGYSYTYGPIKSRRVALTFDDCPRSMTAFRRVVLGAEKLDVALMLFPTGNCVTAGRFSASYARAHGHYVFNHSISHPDLARLSYAGAVAQLGSPGIQARYGRPPFGAYNRTVAGAYAAKGMKIWTWTVDTLDWHGRSQQNVVSTAVHSPRAGGTVLMHMQWHGFSVDALRQMKAGLDKRGLGTCRNYPGTTPVRSWAVRC